jgi:hypothetical protein
MGVEYGYTPAQVAAMPDEQLWDMMPGLVESEAEGRAQAAMEQAMANKLSEWRKTHPGEPMPIA